MNLVPGSATDSSWIAPAKVGGRPMPPPPMPLDKLSSWRSVICERRGSSFHWVIVRASFSSHDEISPSAIAAAAATPLKLFVPLANS